MAPSAAGLSHSVASNMSSMLHLTGVDGREQRAYHATPPGGFIVYFHRIRPVQLRVRCATHLGDFDDEKSHGMIHWAWRRSAKKNIILCERTALQQGRTGFLNQVQEKHEHVNMEMWGPGVWISD